MKPEELLEEAAGCRLQALAYVGKREAPFLLRVASAFEAIAFQSTGGDGKKAEREGSSLLSE
jgi:hypothetical protein